MNKYQKQALKESLTAFGVLVVVFGVPAALFAVSEYLFGSGFPAMILMIIGMMVAFYKASAYQAMEDDASKRTKRKKKA